MERTRTGAAWLLTGAGLLVLVAVGAAGGGVVSGDRLPVPPLPSASGRGPDGPGEVLVPTAAPTAPPDPPSVPPDLGRVGQVALVLLAVLVAGLLALLVRRLLAREDAAEPAVRRPAPPVTVDEPAEEAAQALRAAQAALAAEGSARQRVLRCWVGLEEAVAGTGVPRGAGETAGELTSRVLSAQVRDPAPLRELHGLYAAARYAPDEVGADVPERAAALLAAVERDLAGTRAG